MERRRNFVEYGVLTASSLAVAFFGGWLWRADNQTSTLPPLFQNAPKTQTHSGAHSSTPGPAASNRGSVVVHVVGAVRKPGVLTLSANKRVNDAIRAAGGVTAGANVHALNLAARLEDGQQIRVPTRAEVTSQRVAESSDRIAATAPNGGASASAKNAGGDKPSRPINVNTASAAELEELPGVGPAIAARLIAYRAQKGRFQRMEDLDKVKGLGPRKIETLRPWVRF